MAYKNSVTGPVPEAPDKVGAYQYRYVQRRLFNQVIDGGGSVSGGIVWTKKLMRCVTHIVLGVWGTFNYLRHCECRLSLDWKI